MEPVRERIPLLARAAGTKPYSVDTLMLKLGDKVDTHPIYQRDIRWSWSNFCDFIATIMMTGFVPAIVLYKLQPTDPKKFATQTKECVDGQHRFFALEHYFYSKPVELDGKKPFMISWCWQDEQTGRVTHVFYAKNEATEKWEAENRQLSVAYMTEAEKDHFNDFPINITEFEDPMTLQQRREIFCSLQKGVPVRGSDLYKNFTDVRLVSFITEEMAWESKLRDKMLSYLTKSVKSFWIHWFVRMFMITRAVMNEGDVENAYGRTDGEITKMFKDNRDLTSTEEEEVAYMEAIDRFFRFLDTLPAGIKFSPTHFYALFTHFLHEGSEREDILRGHMAGWTKDGVSKEAKKMWEKGHSKDERVAYFNHCLDSLERIKHVAREVGARKSIPKKIRDKCWSSVFGKAESGTCHCCSEEITLTTWHCGHIIAHAQGGDDSLSNLRPVCGSCNCSMGTENMDDFKKRCYPQNGGGC